VKSINDPVHSFVVRIWIEHTERKDAEPIWRGVIEQVGSNQRVYFDHLDKVRIYFAQYLEQIGVKNNTSQK